VNVLLKVGGNGGNGGKLSVRVAIGGNVFATNKKKPPRIAPRRLSGLRTSLTNYF
jgi:hypothetical protein